MIVRFDGEVLHVGPSSQVTFGRSTDCDLTLDSRDVSISRRAGMLRFESDTWLIENTGRRTFYLVEPSGEIELSPGGTAFARRVVHHHSWIRVPGRTLDHAIVLTVPELELPRNEPRPAGVEDGATAGEAVVTLTDNERRSILAIYDGYLRLPPHHTRRPNSFRAVAVKLGVEPGKVKADHRRVVEKVAASGGPIDGNLDRDALVAWLLTRRVISPDEIEAPRPG